MKNSYQKVRTCEGQLVDVIQRKIYPARLTIENGSIVSVKRIAQAPEEYILPGFIDAHIHIESSMLTPSAFARCAVRHGTVATVSDPHEIANVLGIPGVQFMIDNGNKVPFTFVWGAPSCVPSTSFETAGARLGIPEVSALLAREEIAYLSEVMNYPAVIAGETEMMGKIAAARSAGKPVDGHAPGLQGDALETYISAGITTDHESVTLKEAEEKISRGMKIIIRQGSAAKNYPALHPILKKASQLCMFGSDDKHPDDLVRGHINELVQDALQKGYDFWDVLYAACVHPRYHYKMKPAFLQEGDVADFIVASSLERIRITKTIIGGRVVFENGESNIPVIQSGTPNVCRAQAITENDVAILAEKNPRRVRVIQAVDGQLVTPQKTAQVIERSGTVVSDEMPDVAKIIVVNRYVPSPVAGGYITGFGFTRGAIASSVAHDSHNIVAVGANDADIVTAVNAVIESGGGIAASANGQTDILPLQIAGLMSTDSAETAGSAYEQLTARARSFGSLLHAPFMTLSFMALPVIPSLKMTDKGLFNVDQFSPVEVMI